jgi:hypothetical protein
MDQKLIVNFKEKLFGQYSFQKKDGLLQPALMWRPTE